MKFKKIVWILRYFLLNNSLAALNPKEHDFNNSLAASNTKDCVFYSSLLRKIWLSSQKISCPLLGNGEYISCAAFLLEKIVPK